MLELQDVFFLGILWNAIASFLASDYNRQVSIIQSANVRNVLRNQQIREMCILRFGKTSILIGA